MTMLDDSATAALDTSLIGVATPAIARTPVAETAGEADLGAIEDARAATDRAAISDRLEYVIAAHGVGHAAEEAAGMSVDIYEVELANSLRSTVRTGESRRMGRVNVSHECNNMAAEDAGPFLMPGTDLTAITIGSRVCRDAMIADAADRVVTRPK